MNCSQFRSRLHSLVEERSSVRGIDDGLRDHLANCGDTECRGAWLEVCLLDEAIGDWAGSFPEPDLGERVVRELRSSAGASSEVRPVGGSGEAGSVDTGSRVQSRWVVVSVALLVLVSLVALISWTQRAGNDLVEPGLITDDSIPNTEVAERGFEPPTAPFAPPEREFAEAELNSAYLNIAEGATQFLTDTVVLTLAGEEDIENPTAAAEFIHRVRNRVGPWGDEFDAALDRFLGTLPDSESS